MSTRAIKVFTSKTNIPNVNDTGKTIGACEENREVWLSRCEELECLLLSIFYRHGKAHILCKEIMNTSAIKSLTQKTHLVIM
jgi:hypothetical protein